MFEDAFKCPRYENNSDCDCVQCLFWEGDECFLEHALEYNIVFEIHFDDSKSMKEINAIFDELKRCGALFLELKQDYAIFEIKEDDYNRLKKVPNFGIIILDQEFTIKARIRKYEDEEYDLIEKDLQC